MPVGTPQAGRTSTGTGDALISFPAREPRNTRARGPAADEPTASSSPACQSMLVTDSSQPEPVAITHGTSWPMTPSAKHQGYVTAFLRAMAAKHQKPESEVVADLAKKVEARVKRDYGF